MTSNTSVTPPLSLWTLPARALSRVGGSDGVGWVPVIAGGVFVILLILAAFGSLITPYSPTAQDLEAASAGPSPAHLLGTDQLGRDILSRIMVGARTAIFGPLLIAAATTLLSTVIGVLAGYLGGWTDSITGRILDVIYALPPLLVAIVAVGLLGGGFTLGVIVLIALNIPAGYRNMRAASLEQRALPYIESALMLGRSRWSIMVHHILPNIRPVIYVTFFLSFTYGFVDLSTLSFLGLGVAPGTPDWGLMAAENRTLVFQNPAALIAPLLLIVIAAVSANLIGLGLDRGGRRRA
ncbi:UNVERIFIED_ORG: peptide/nickel transport system permease protein [Paenarthrobacter nicotinovorans]